MFKEEEIPAIPGARDVSGTFKSEKQIRLLARQTLNEMSQWELVDIIMMEVSLYDLAHLFAQDEDGVWYE